jgi:hypothetical protein
VQLDVTGIDMDELAKTALFELVESLVNTIMVDINLHHHCRIFLNFIQIFPGYDFKNSNHPFPPHHYGDT